MACRKEFILNTTKRTIQKKFRVSNEELKLLEEKLSSTGLSLQTYMVRTALGMPIHQYPVGLDSKLSEIYRSLRNVQGNVNQIAHACNSGGIDPTTDIDDVLMEVKAVADEIASYFSSITRGSEWQ